jgi:hypothetical protein
MRKWWTRFRIHRTRVELVSSSEGFSSFAAQMLESHRDEESEPPDLRVRFDGYGSRLVSSAPASDLRGLTKLDTSIYEGEGLLRYVDGQYDVAVRTARSPTVLEVSGSYRERADHTVRRLLNKSILTNNYQQILRNFVLRPVFLLEEMRFGCVPLHAGVVTNGVRTLVLTGLSGVGKSTLALFISTMPGWSFVADNYAGAVGDEVFGVREPVRVSDATARLLGPERAKQSLVRSQGAFGNRRCYTLRGRAVESANATDVFHLKLGSAFGVRKLGHDQMHDAIYRASNYLKEFHANSYMELYGGAESGVARLRVERLDAFLRAKNLFELTLSRSDSLEVAFARVCHEISLV